MNTQYIVEITHKKPLNSETVQELIAQRVFNKLAESGDQAEVVVREAAGEDSEGEVTR